MEYLEKSTSGNQRVPYKDIGDFIKRELGDDFHAIWRDNFFELVLVGAIISLVLISLAGVAVIILGMLMMMFLCMVIIIAALFKMLFPDAHKTNEYFKV